MLASLFLTTALLFMGYAGYSLHTLLYKVRPLGIPYFVIPFYPSPFSRIFLIPFVNLLIKVFGLTHPRFFLMTLDWQVRQRYEMYRFIRSDIFFTVTPWKVILHVADPDMAVEVLAGKGGNGELYTRPDVYNSMLGLFGENVLTEEGAVWRDHRKITAPVIGKSLSVVWEESLTQIQQMIRYYDKHEAINTSYRDFRRATLGVIARAGFSKVMEWCPLATAIANEKDDEGSYQKCLHVLFENFMWAVIAPSWILEMLPFKALREAGGAANNFRFFVNEWFEEKKTKIELDNKTTLGPSSKADLMVPLLSKSEVIGNAFAQAHPLSLQHLANSPQIFILAGHETSAHTIANAIYLLAMYPEYQVKLQEEIDSILGDSDHNQTSYKTHFDAFSSGWIAAILFETLRLIPELTVMARQIGPTPRTFPRAGDLRPITLPPGIEFWIHVIGLSHNPKYWTQPGKTEAESAISEFRPERWLPKSGDSTMLKPYNGSYIPFSIGARGCIGKKFAHVEFTAIMLGLFREMSVEFDSCGGRKTFDEARLECLAEMENFESKITLQPSGEMPSIKWVRRRR
ncbi:cytochrome P450 [Tuber borchii]|uniref:Cytochrome P450 n=1 Tax=Tuber borchii TaxID=42251 RepID=A0A2T6ZQC6_TUBBO|nr:cytochrome P450 [Tuber borchii]